MFSMFCFQMVREAAADSDIIHISQAAKCQTLSVTFRVARNTQQD